MSSHFCETSHYFAVSNIRQNYRKSNRYLPYFPRPPGHFLISAGSDYALAFCCQELFGENEGFWHDGWPTIHGGFLFPDLLQPKLHSDNGIYRRRCWQAKKKTRHLPGIKKAEGVGIESTGDNAIAPPHGFEGIQEGIDASSIPSSFRMLPSLPAAGHKPLTRSCSGVHHLDCRRHSLYERELH